MGVIRFPSNKDVMISSLESVLEDAKNGHIESLVLAAVPPEADSVTEVFYMGNNALLLQGAITNIQMTIAMKINLEND